MIGQLYQIFMRVLNICFKILVDFKTDLLFNVRWQFFKFVFQVSRTSNARNALTKRNKSLIRHMNCIHKFPSLRMSKCDDCSSSFKLKSHLTNHVNKNHIDQFQCGEWSMAFNCRHEYIEHVRDHNADNFLDESDTVGPYKIIKTKKLVKPVNRFQCRQCSKKFYDYSNFKRHYNIHMNYKPYKCNVCRKRFVQKDDLKKRVLRAHKSLAWTRT